MTGIGGPTGGWELNDTEERRREAFENLIDEALERIPSPFRERLDTVAVVAEDEALPGQAAPGQILMGLFQGVPRTAWGADGAAVANKITIFRRPHERFYPDPVARAAAVEATVFHEVAHHFGISDDRLRELQRRG